jgi:hypothetical protein
MDKLEKPFGVMEYWRAGVMVFKSLRALRLCVRIRRSMGDHFENENENENDNNYN